MTNDKPVYTVWIGGSEATWELLFHKEAVALAEYWRAKGYDDVAVVEVEAGGDK